MKKILKAIASVAGTLLYGWLKKKNVIKVTTEDEARLVGVLNYYGVKFDYEKWQALRAKVFLILDDLRDIHDYFNDPAGDHEFNNMKFWLHTLRFLPQNDVITMYLEAQIEEPVYINAKQKFLDNATQLIKAKES